MYIRYGPAKFSHILLCGHAQVVVWEKVHTPLRAVLSTEMRHARVIFPSLCVHAWTTILLEKESLSHKEEEEEENEEEPLCDTRARRQSANLVHQITAI